MSQRDLPCAFDPCDRKAWAKKLCRSHYAQQGRGKPLTPLRVHNPRSRDDRGRKRCSVCGEWLPESRFDLASDRADGLMNHCKACRQVYDMKRNYGLTPAEYGELLAKQGNRCPICDRDAGRPGRNGWNVDHDHECCPGIRTCGECIRGLLCGFCNRGLGLFQDSPELLRAAANYLDSYREKQE